MDARLQLTHEVQEASGASSRFLQLAHERGLHFTRTRRIRADAFEPSALAGQDVLAGHIGKTFNEHVLSLADEAIALVSARQGRAAVTVAAADAATAAQEAGRLASRFADAAGPRMALHFWTPARFGPEEAVRLIDAPAWPDVRPNYAHATGLALDALMSARHPGAGGLLVWSGEPGTGKSYAVRALAREWQEWCDVHVVSEPDLLIGGRGETILGDAMAGGDRDRHRLFVLEDAGELIAPDASANAGHAVARLLNLTDGLLGAGMHAMVLITTNEPVQRLHPALSRPGRCWARVAFDRMDVGAAREWLRARGAVTALDRPATLAELFALEQGGPLNAGREFGFRGAQAGAGAD